MHKYPIVKQSNVKLLNKQLNISNVHIPKLYKSNFHKPVCAPVSDVSNLLFSTVSHKKSPYLLVIWKQCSIPILVTHNKNLYFLLVVSYVLYITAWISVICKQCTHLYCELKMYWNLSDVSNVPKLNTQPYLHLPVRF